MAPLLCSLGAGGGWAGLGWREEEVVVVVGFSSSADHFGLLVKLGHGSLW